MHNDEQLEALTDARKVIRALPSHTVYSLCVTNDDDREHPSVLNIFLTSSEQKEIIAQMLNLKNPVDTQSDFLSYRKGILLISLIEGQL